MCPINAKGFIMAQQTISFGTLKELRRYAKVAFGAEYAWEYNIRLDDDFRYVIIPILTDEQWDTYCQECMEMSELEAKEDWEDMAFQIFEHIRKGGE